MVSSPTQVSIEHNGSTVKPGINTQFSSSVDTMIHHKGGKGEGFIVIRKPLPLGPPGYGVSRASRLIPASLFIKKYNYIKSCLKDVVGLTDCQVEAVMRLLRIQAYYGVAYPKAAQIASDFQEPPPGSFLPYPGYVPPQRHYWGTSRATFWRAIRVLKGLELITVINRYIMRPHAQISNLYKLDRLLILLARYLAEHGIQFWQEWLKPYLRLPGSTFWASFWGQSRPSPRGLTEAPG